ncbi:hypothetical protein Y032_0095g2784 [Ancylostoma ceylanicum]|nr:hypothetical protein Y032_0095g2784 [Ancylostoma ceylanicum]
MVMSNVGLERCRLGIWILSIVADLVLLIGTLTPAWQVAEDTDVGRYVQSGLWLYCPGAAQCWYIFSDNLINYYERDHGAEFLGRDTEALHAGSGVSAQERRPTVPHLVYGRLEFTLYSFPNNAVAILGKRNFISMFV